MLKPLADLFPVASFIPHGHCYLWNPVMVGLQILANGVIAASYVAISATLAYLVYRMRGEIPFQRMYLAFGAFIVLCGITHLFDIYLIWQPDYWADGVVRAITAVVSAGTALLLPPLIPHAMALARGSKAARDRGIELETAVKDLATMYEKTKELETLKSQFFANVSHELRTPLALILGPVEMLLGARNLDPGQRRNLERVLRSARLLHKQVDDLLDAARLEAGKLKPDYANVDVAQIVRLVAANFDGYATDHGIHYATAIPVALPGQVDPDQLQRIVLNLLSNAFKFTPCGGGIRCELAAKGGPDDPAGHCLTITVADSGPGTAPEHREAIFERFRQLDGGVRRRVGGTGLGLAIIKEFIVLHSGHIAVGEAPEGGALFTVELPLTAPPGVAVRATVADTNLAAAETMRHAMAELHQRLDAVPPDPIKPIPLVLLVEDNTEMNRFIVETLAGHCRVETALDGREGLRKALAVRPDLILTDIMMPGVSGRELVRQLRTNAEFNRVPIIVLSAKGDDELRSQLLREGAQDYVTKPFSVEELRARVGNLVTLKRAQDVLLETIASAERANVELEAFSYAVSNNLRAPLRAMEGFSQLLRESYADRIDEKGRNYLGRIQASASRMSDLIDDLLRLSRVSRTDLVVVPVDLSQLARSAVDELASRQPRRRVQTVIEDNLTARGDVRLLRLVLQNLIGNAWKFTRDVDAPRIEVGALRQDRHTVFFIRDNGVGFDNRYVGKLFEPFQGVHRKTEFPGAGIGLATVRRIVARHGGRVWAECTPEAGTTFWFTLAAEPVAHGQPDDMMRLAAWGTAEIAG